MSNAATIEITNVHVFDGMERGDRLATVTIAGGVIRDLRFAGDANDNASAADESVDGAGGTLLPGLIDAHVHFAGPGDLERLTDFGVTTALDMSTWPPELVASLRATADLTDIRSAGVAAIGPGGAHARMPGLPAERIITTPEEARHFVEARIAEGVDFIKVVAEAPGRGGPDEPTLTALVAAAHDANRLVIAHAVSVGAFELAMDAGADVITHAPLNAALPAAAAERMRSEGRVSVPTLIMMEGVAGSGIPGLSFENAVASVRSLHEAGVPILAGTDANDAPGVPAKVPHGEGLHRELELLVSAGLAPAEALESATSLSARLFGLDDRGAVRPGLRADLLLVDGDPTRDIRASRDIRGVWIAGVKVR